MLLQDVFVIDKLTVVNEGKSNSSMKIRGVFQRADEANANKRIYRKSILENSIKSLKPLIEGRMLVGELDHPDANIVRLQNASHVITNLKMVGNEMIGEAEILSTPAGQVVKALISDGVKIGVSSRGMGTISEDKDGVKYVNEDFKLVTFDIVADPSTRGAYPGLTESKKVDMDETIKKAFGEKVLLALLKENLDEGSHGLRRMSRISSALRKKAKATGDKSEFEKHDAEHFHLLTSKIKPRVKRNPDPAPGRITQMQADRKELNKKKTIPQKPGMHESDENLRLTIESLKQRILDMSVISEGSLGSKRIGRVSNSLAAEDYHGKKWDKFSAVSRYKKSKQLHKDRKIEAPKIKSNENSQITLESLKQEILNRSRIKKD